MSHFVFFLLSRFGFGSLWQFFSLEVLMIWWAIGGVVSWLASGVIGAGMWLHYMNEEYPEFAYPGRLERFMFLGCTLGGPCGLIGTLLSLKMITGRYTCPWTARFITWDEAKAAHEQKYPALPFQVEQ